MGPIHARDCFSIHIYTVLVGAPPVDLMPSSADDEGARPQKSRLPRRSISRVQFSASSSVMSANGDGTDTMSDMRDGNEEIGSANGRSSKRPSPRPSAGAPEEEEDSKLREFEMSLQSYDWETLQNKFAEAMEERTQAEMALQRETADLLEVGWANPILALSTFYRPSTSSNCHQMFISWSQTTGLRDEDRAYKRYTLV